MIEILQDREFDVGVRKDSSSSFECDDQVEDVEDKKLHNGNRVEAASHGTSDTTSAWSDEVL